MNLARRGCTMPFIPPHMHRVSFRMSAVMAATAPTSIDLRETGLVADVRDQGGSSACESHSGSGVTETAFALLGEPLGFSPSEDLWYKGLRAIDRERVSPTPIGTDPPTLEDGGGMTEDAIAFAAAFGIAPRKVQRTSDGRNSDVEMATVNAEPDFGALETAATKIVTGPYAIDPTAPDAEHQVQAALAAKIPVRVDAFVDTAFEDWAPGRAPIPTPDTTDVNGGGHAIYLVGYRPGAYVLRNSWGTSWGDGGDCLVSPAWLRACWGIYPWIVKRAS